MFQILNRPPESDASCQTDFFLDRPDSPVYVPTKVGLDVETQIYPGDVSFNTAINFRKAAIEITWLRNKEFWYLLYMLRLYIFISVQVYVFNNNSNFIIIIIVIIIIT